MKLGRKGTAWANARAKLKKEFYERNIVTCELNYDGCWINSSLGFAHTRKRRNVTDLFRVVLACNHCHARVERLPELEMEIILETIIRGRDTNI